MSLTGTTSARHREPVLGALVNARSNIWDTLLYVEEADHESVSGSPQSTGLVAEQKSRLCS